MNRSMVITEDFFALFLKLFALGIFLRGFQCPLISGHCAGSGRKRINDWYSTVRDGIVDGIFPYSSLNLSVGLFYRLQTLGYFLCSNWEDLSWNGYRVRGGCFNKRLQQHGQGFRNETQLLKNLARFLLVFILIHGKDKHDRLLVQLVRNGLTEGRIQNMGSMDHPKNKRSHR